MNRHTIPITDFDFEQFDVPVLDSEERRQLEERQERDEKILTFFENVFHMLNAYQSHQETAEQLRMSTRAMCMAIGFHLAAGAEGPAELARKFGMKKQTVGKCLNHFLEQLRLEPLPFQRKPQARENMASARKRQLQPHENQCRD